MSDISQGPGWWQASDGKWYPPEQAPGGAPAGPPPGTPPAYGAPPSYGTPPPGYGAAPGYAPTPGDVTVGSAFNYGWEKFQKNVGPILIAMLAYMVGSFFIYIIAIAAISSLDAGLFGQLLIQIVFALIFGLVQMAIIRASLQIIDGQELQLSTMFATEQLGQYILAVILVAIATGIGYVLCIIPGIIISFFAAYFGYFLLDRKLGAVDAIKASFTFVQENLGTLVVFFLACIAAEIVGAILCGVGLFVAIPVVLIAQAYMYRRLSGGTVAP